MGLQDQHRTARRRFRFSLAWALAAMTLLCLMFASYFYLGIDGIAWWSLVGVLMCVWYGARTRKVGRAILGVGLITLISLVVSLPVLRAPSQRSAQMACHNNLRSLIVGLHVFHDTYKHLPAQATTLSGDDALSWRVTILPYLDYERLHRSFNQSEPWDGPTNSQFFDSMPPLYSCVLDNPRDKRHTSYVAIAGNDSCWSRESKISLKDLSDGASNTVVLIEMHDSGIVWSEPRDLDAASTDWRINGKRRASPSSMHGPLIHYVDGSRRLMSDAEAHVAYADGSVRRLSSDIDPAVLKQLVNRRDGQPMNWPP